MALKLTSKEGKVQQLVGTPLTCYLYDFDIDGATLKPEHLSADLRRVARRPLQ